MIGAGPRGHIALSITEGRTVRDLFYNGLLDQLRDAGFTVTVFTEAVTVPAFVQEWQQPGVEFASLPPCGPTKWRSRALHIRRRLVRLRSRRLLRAYTKWEERWFYRPRPELLDRFRRRRPDVVLATHAHLPNERELLSAAHALGISTLGVIRSWDNVYKGIYSRPERLAVWNEINREEVVEQEGYDPDDITVIGSPQFDPYFSPDSIWPRKRLAAHFRLDPNRPILLFATLGYFVPGFDETFWMDALLELIENGVIPGKPQVICRLHPWSRLEHFQRYANYPSVRLSYVNRYWPGLTWYMNREDVVLMANMLRHADVVITPGSTVTLEAAIFDRPTVVPIFHTYQPERAKAYFSRALGRHFGRIDQLNLVPIIRNSQDFGPAIIRCLEEPGWYAEARSQLVADYVHFTDGRSTERLAELVSSMVDENSSDPRSHV